VRLKTFCKIPSFFSCNRKAFCYALVRYEKHYDKNIQVRIEENRGDDDDLYK
jgi:hypothetical protein